MKTFSDIYDPITIPKEIIDAAILIEEWTIKNGWKDWRIHGIADRKLVEKLEDQIRGRDKLMEGILNYEGDEDDD